MQTLKETTPRTTNLFGFRVNHKCIQRLTLIISLVVIYKMLFGSIKCIFEVIIDMQLPFRKTISKKRHTKWDLLPFGWQKYRKYSLPLFFILRISKAHLMSMYFIRKFSLSYIFLKINRAKITESDYTKLLNLSSLKCCKAHFFSYWNSQSKSNKRFEMYLPGTEKHSCLPLFAASINHL